MGQIIIEIPQNINQNYRIASEDSAAKLISALERIVQKEKDEDEDILGLWTIPQKPIGKPAV